MDLEAIDASDAETLSRADLLEDLYREHRTRLARAAYLLTGGKDPEDLVQDAIVRALRRWDPARPREGFGAWAQTTMLRLYLNRLRRARYDRAAAPLIAEPDTALPADPGTDVVRALAMLPPRQRAAIVLRYYEDLSEADIADRMGCRPGTVKALLHQARARLRVELSED